MIETYLDLGMALVAVPKNTKNPGSKGWGEKGCTDLDKLRSGNVGLIHALSGTACLDVDDVAKFTAWWDAQGFNRAALKAMLEAAPMWTSGKPGRFKALFRAPEGMRLIMRGNHGFELRGAGGQDLLPPSSVDGWEYHWLSDLPGDMDDLPMMPAKLIAAAEATSAKEAVAVDMPGVDLMAAVLDKRMEGGRNNYLSEVAYAKARSGIEGDELFAEVMAVNEDKCEPPLEESEVRAICAGKKSVEPDETAQAAKDYARFVPTPYYRLHGSKIEAQATGDQDDNSGWTEVVPYGLFVTGVVRVPGVQEKRFIEITVVNGKESKHYVTMMQLCRDTEITLNDIGISYMGKRAGSIKAYLLASKAKLEQEQKVIDSYAQFGWQDDGSFLIGDRLYTKGEAPKRVHLEMHASGIARFMPLIGSIPAWVEAAQPLFEPANIRQGFAFVASLSSVLMKLSGERGGILSLVGHSGQGKSTVQSAITSVFGTQESAFSKAQDTENARVAFLSLMHNLPVQAEELTKLDPQKLSVLAYDVSEGRDKRRSTRSGDLREMRAEWHTILTSSSNTSIVEKLMSIGAAPEAYRVLEMRVMLPPGAKLQNGDAMKRALMLNAGAAGHALAQFLVDHRDQLEKRIEMLKAALVERTQATTDERIRINIVACAGVMAAVMNAALKTQVDPKAIIDFGVKLIEAHRETRIAFSSEAVDVLNDFINENMNRCIQSNISGNVVEIVKAIPPYTLRYEARNKALWVAMGPLRRYVLGRRVDWSDFQQELTNLGIMKKSARIMLTRGAIGLPPQAATQAIHIDAKALELEFEADTVDEAA